MGVWHCANDKCTLGCVARLWMIDIHVCHLIQKYVLYTQTQRHRQRYIQTERHTQTQIDKHTCTDRHTDTDTQTYTDTDTETDTALQGLVSMIA